LPGKGTPASPEQKPLWMMPHMSTSAAKDLLPELSQAALLVCA
jgi:hypothetical protein